jgi:ComF family protein
MPSPSLRRSRLFRVVRRRALACLREAEDWLIPPACGHCGKRRFATMPLCRACLRVVRDARPEEDEAIPGMPWARAMFRLTPPLHGLIHGFKYRHERRHVRLLCAWMRWRRLWRDDLARSYDALVPVPLHPARRRERGYNQAAAIARAIGRSGGVPVREDLLRRVRRTGTQTRLGGRKRASNLDGAFRAAPARSEAGLRLLLVDDVCTTGSTLGHCRDALLAAGARRVDALVLARVEKDGAKAPLPDFETAAAFFA